MGDLTDLTKTQPRKSRKARTFVFVTGMIGALQLFVLQFSPVGFGFFEFCKIIMLLSMATVVIIAVITLLLVILKRARFLEFLAYVGGILLLVIIIGAIESKKYEERTRRRMHLADSLHHTTPK